MIKKKLKRFLMFKTETHLHVAEVSNCSKVKAAEMVKLYMEAGYKTLFVTDHLSPAYLGSLGDISWADKVTVFLSGYFKASAVSSKYGVNVIFGAEISLKDCPNHYLAYGITREFLNAHPNICEMTPEELFLATRGSGILLVQAHPYRDGRSYPTPDCVDGIEIYNSNPRHQDYYDRCEELAREHGLYVTGGSDAHRLDDYGLGGIMTECEIKSAEDLIDAVKNGNAVIIRGEE